MFLLRYDLHSAKCIDFIPDQLSLCPPRDNYHFDLFHHGLVLPVLALPVNGTIEYIVSSFSHTLILVTHISDLFFFILCTAK